LHVVFSTTTAVENATCNIDYFCVFQRTFSLQQLTGSLGGRLATDTGKASRVSSSSKRLHSQTLLLLLLLLPSVMASRHLISAAMTFPANADIIAA